ERLSLPNPLYVYAAETGSAGLLLGCRAAWLVGGCALSGGGLLRLLGLTASDRLGRGGSLGIGEALLERVHEVQDHGLLPVLAFRRPLARRFGFEHPGQALAVLIL